MKAIKIIAIALLAFSALTVQAQEEEPRLVVSSGEMGLHGFDFTDGPFVENSWVHGILLKPTQDNWSITDDWIGSGFLHLPAGDYQVFFLPIPAWSEWSSIADVTLSKAEASSCESGRNNRQFNYNNGWEVIMFCDGRITWSITSDSFGVIMVILELNT